MNTETSFEVSGSALQNRTSSSPEHNYYTSKQRKEQIENHQDIEKNERHEADEYLTEELQNLDETISTQEELNSFLENNFPNNDEAKQFANEYFARQNQFGIEITEQELLEKLYLRFSKSEKLSTADQIKLEISQLEGTGKSRTEILKNLVSKYENEPAVKTWVENWKNFLALQEFAESKPPTEQIAIERIISGADFTAENSFDTALKEISKNAEISTQTKFEISKRFGGDHINSVSEMDNMLRHVKSHKEEIEKAIDTQKTTAENLETAIADIEKQLADLSPDDPQREELKAKLANRTQQLQQTQTELEQLESAKPNEVSFTLRQKVSAKLNPDGSRSIRLNDSDFEIRLPDNRIFMDRKNLNSINLAFSYNALQKIGLANVIFAPPLTNNTVPLLAQRKMGAKILQSLGYNPGQIISQRDIYNLEKDLRLLKQPGSNNSPVEDLQELGIWNVAKQKINSSRLFSTLKFIRENRGKNINFEALNDLFASKD